MKITRRSLVAAVGAALAVPLLAVGSSSPPAQAAGSSSTLPRTAGYQIWYAYADAGEPVNVTITKAATALSQQKALMTDQVVTVESPSGTDRTCTIKKDAANGTKCSWSGLTAGEAGIWKITSATSEGAPVQPSGASTFYDWSISVTGHTGRVFTEIYRAGQQKPPADKRTFVLHYMSKTGYLWRATYSAYNGIYSNLLATEKGVVKSATGEPAYASITQASAAAGTYETIGSKNETYRVFFEAPDPSMPAAAKLPNGSTTWLNPAAAPLRPSFTNASASVNAQGTAATFTWTSANNAKGASLLDIDVDGNGSYTDAADIKAMARWDADGQHTYTWNLKDAQGNKVAPGEVTFRIRSTREGEIHFTNTDVEYRAGLKVERLTTDAQLDIPATSAASKRTLYWDDRSLSTTGRKVTPVRDGRAGLDSLNYVHGLPSTGDGTSDGWGNARVIDDWAYVPAERSVEASAVIPEPQVPHLSVSKTSNASGKKAGDTIDYTITAVNDGIADLNDVLVVDDLTGVLDDAELDESTIETDRPGLVGYNSASKRITWKGDLAVGEKVTFTFRVAARAQLDGDLKAHNPVIATTIPPNVPPGAFTCEDVQVGDLTDCDEVEDPFEPRALSVEKTSKASGKKAGDTIDYTIVGSNTGRIDYTAEKPATVVDDLTGVLDDATLDESSIAADRPGEIGYDAKAKRIVWVGALKSGDKVTITYKVTAHKPLEGDDKATNVVAITDKPDELPPGSFTCDDIKQSATVDCAEVEDPFDPDGPLGGLLPNAGGPQILLAVAGLGLLGTGGGLLLVSRKRRQNGQHLV